MKNRHNIICIALLALFLSHYCGATLFFHTHDFDGKQITHSHPYAPASHHSHSAAGFHLIDSLSVLLFALGVALSISVSLGALSKITIPAQLRIDILGSKHCSLRAPPSFY